MYKYTKTTNQEQENTQTQEGKQEYSRFYELVTNESDKGLTTERLKVPNGWIVRVIAHWRLAGASSSSIVSIEFVPDKNHEWTFIKKS